MSLYCFLRDEEERCDVAVSISCGDLLKDLNLSLAQRFSPKMLHELSCDLVRDVFLPPMHLADHIYELFSGHAFEHVALCSSLQRALYLGFSFNRRSMITRAFANSVRMASNASMPPISGIRTSISVTSGRCSRNPRIASCPVDASATNCMSGSFL